MAAPLHVHSSQASPLPNSIKELSDSAGLSSIPFLYASRSSEALLTDVVEHEVPIIDFSLLKNGTPDQRSQTVRDLGKACEEWGFFKVVNHGVPERLKDAMVDALGGFFDLTEEEKGEYTGKHVMDPIRCGTSFNLNVDKFRFWRDYLKVFVHPVFHSPAKPHGFREISQEYTTCMRVLAMDLLAGIWESLGLEESNLTTALDLHSCFQIFIGNYYPPCPQPELAMGLPPHSDHGLLTILLQNGVDGLQLKHKGNWVNVKPHPNSFLVNTGDHMEIISNGKYKSVVHRAVVNSKSTRISIANAIGPSLDAVVVPAMELVSDGGSSVAYHGMRYREFIEHQQANPLKDKSVLDRIRL